MLRLLVAPKLSRIKSMMPLNGGRDAMSLNGVSTGSSEPVAATNIFVNAC